MPIKITAICNCIGPLEDRLDAFRQTIPPDEGYSAQELSKLPQVNGGETAIRRLMKLRQWAVKIKDHRPGGNTISLLVHPKTLAKYAVETAKK